MESAVSGLKRVAVLAAPLLLAACSGSHEKTALFCPTVSVLTQANQMVKARGDATSVGAREISARITGVAGRCATHGKNGVLTVFRVGFAATRGPALIGDQITLPYFIVLTQGDQIIGKQIDPITFDFKNGRNRAVATTKPIKIEMPNAPVSAQQEALIGFQFKQSPQTGTTGDQH
ncbi:MAG: hypothetical protein B7X48_06655 [Acidiphilium sp. 34-60-192]|nr:MAG: hypothetical protein B7X48_06655 [Acidiphilium sp. 34-60-192]